MKTYYCPYCNANLSVLNGSVIQLKGVLSSETFDCVADFFLPASLGEYDSIFSDYLQVKKGAKVDFRCPQKHCDESLTCHYDDDLAEIKMVDEKDNVYVVIFNRIFGKHATFLADHKKQEMTGSFGADKEDYIDFLDKKVNFFGE